MRECRSLRCNRRLLFGPAQLTNAFVKAIPSQASERMLRLTRSRKRYPAAHGEHQAGLLSTATRSHALVLWPRDSNGALHWMREANSKVPCSARPRRAWSQCRPTTHPTRQLNAFRTTAKYSKSVPVRACVSPRTLELTGMCVVKCQRTRSDVGAVRPAYRSPQSATSTLPRATRLRLQRIALGDAPFECAVRSAGSAEF